jgi:hypothetical protein
VRHLARRRSLEAGSTREKQGGEERSNVRKLRVAVRHGKQEMPVARARVSRTGNNVILLLKPLELWAPCKARWVWAGAVIFPSATARNSSPRPTSQRFRNMRRRTRQMYSEEELIYPALSVQR